MLSLVYFIISASIKVSLKVSVVIEILIAERETHVNVHEKWLKKIKS